MNEEHADSSAAVARKPAKKVKNPPSVLDESILPPPRVVEEEARLNIGALAGYEAWAWYQAFLGWIPGRIGWVVRQAAYRPFFQRAGKGWHFGEFCSVQRVQYFQIGHRFAVGRFCVINALGGVILGDYSGIGPYVQIMSSTHNFYKEKVSGLPYGLSSRPLETAPVIIGKHVWIGAGVVILPGVRIGENAVVAAGTLVNRDVPAFSMVAGVPARLAWQKSKEELENSEGEYIYRSLLETLDKRKKPETQEKTE